MDHQTLFGRTTLDKLFCKFEFITPSKMGQVNYYPATPGWFLIGGMPGFLDFKHSRVLAAHVKRRYINDIQDRLFNRVVGEFEIMRSHRNPQPETMLLVAHGTHRMNKVDVALIPYMTDEEVAEWLKNNLAR